MKISTLFQTGKKIDSAVTPKADFGLTHQAVGAKDKNTSESILSDFKSSGLKSGEALQSLFKSYGVKPTKESVSQVTAFMNQAKGTEGEKLKTVETALYKGIELTQDNLSTLHQALVEDDIVAQPAAEVPLVQLSKMTSKEIAKLVSHLKLPESIKNALKQLLKNGEPLEQALKTISKQLGITLSEKDSPAQIIQKIKAAIQPDPSITTVSIEAKAAEMAAKALAETQALSSVQTKSSAIVSNGAQTPSSAQVPNSTLASSGAQAPSGALASNDAQVPSSALAPNGAQVPSSAQAPNGAQAPNLTQIQNDVQFSNGEQSVGASQVIRVIQSQEKAEEGFLNQIAESELTLGASNDLESIIEGLTEQLLEDVSERFASLAEGLSLKTFFVETVTEATLAAKKTFETFKTDFSAVLEQAKQMPSNAAVKLSQAMELLGKTIMRSEVTLYADMKTERSLLVMGAELEKAEAALRQGDFQKAKAVIDKTLELLNKIDFNPSKRKLQVFASNRLEQVSTQFQKNEAPLKPIDMQIKDYLTTQRELPEARLSRDILDTIRFLGLNHEAEVAEALEMEDPETLKEWNRSNVKEILLKSMKEELKERTVNASGETMMNLSGQQMMNDSGQREQPFHFFNLPIMNGEELGNMKVFMKGADKNGRIDWQNTELYFGVKLGKLGAVTLRVSIIEGSVDFKIKSSDDGSVSDALTIVMDELEALGFTKGKVILSSAHETKEDVGVSLKTEMTAPIRVPLDGKGFDVKI